MEHPSRIVSLEGDGIPHIVFVHYYFGGNGMDNKEKFTTKVADYVKYRPSYPQDFIEYLICEVGLAKDSILADVGAGTGILSKQLANKVKLVYAVEPNLPMRKACETYCASCDNVTAVDGSAEDTTLSPHSVDFISVAQAFHWFDREKTKREFQRILKPGGKVILVWNSRVPEDDLTKENDQLFQRICPDFNEFSGGAGIGPEFYQDFFKGEHCDYRVFRNDQNRVTLEGYIGRSLSASYAPTEQDGNYRAFIEGLTALFDKYSSEGLLNMPYITHSYVGEL
jgi:SAM-dependent methyltransferase